MSKKISESIFNGPRVIIPMADVQQVERWWVSVPVAERTKDNYSGLQIITCHTKWSQAMDTWENNIYLDGDEARAFLKAWCQYRHDLEAPDTGHEDRISDMAKAIANEVLNSKNPDTLDSVRNLTELIAPIIREHLTRP